MEPKVMRNGTVVSPLLVILLLVMGCATMEAARHEYLMRGSVLDVQDGTVYLCLGTAQGAKVGQDFTVRRYVHIPGSRGGYNVDYVGTVKITEVQTHMAWAKILTGDVKANDVVNLNTENP
jgi:hypothetical protein